MILTYPKIKLLIVYSMFISTTKRDPLKSRIPNMVHLHINLLRHSRRMIHQQITNYSSTPASILDISQCKLVYSAHWVNSTPCWRTSSPGNLYTEIFSMTILSSYQHFHRLLHRRSEFSTSQMFNTYVQIIIIFPIEHQPSSILFWVKQIWLSQSLSWPILQPTISTSGAHPPMVPDNHFLHYSLPLSIWHITLTFQINSSHDGNSLDKCSCIGAVTYHPSSSFAYICNI